MHKNNRLNHDFQIVHFMIGACHTPDAAWSMLHAQLDERLTARAASASCALRHKAKIARVKEAAGTSESSRLEAEADLMEFEAQLVTFEKNLAACDAEIATLRKCIERLEPLRKYAHLTDAQAHEAAQAEEWCRELIFRAENYLLTMGTIPHDHFATMRMHPAFASRIAPYLQEMDNLLQTAEGRTTLMTRVSQRKTAALPAPIVQLLENNAP